MPVWRSAAGPEPEVLLLRLAGHPAISPAQEVVLVALNKQVEEVVLVALNKQVEEEAVLVALNKHY